MATTNELRAALAEIGEVIVAHMKELLKDQRFPLTKGRLINSLAAEVTQGRDKAGRFTATAQLAVVAVEYAVYLDQGRRPGTKKIPIAALINWVRSKRIGVGRAGSGKFTARTRSITEIAYAIQQSIYRLGIQGRNFINPSFAVGERLLETYLNTTYFDALTQDVDRFFTR